MTMKKEEVQTSFPGPGAWRSQAAELEKDDPEVDAEKETE